MQGDLGHLDVDEDADSEVICGETANPVWGLLSTPDILGILLVASFNLHNNLFGV